MSHVKLSFCGAGWGGQVAPRACPLTHTAEETRSTPGGVLDSDLDTRYYTPEPEPAFAKVCPVRAHSLAVQKSRLSDLY